MQKTIALIPLRGGSKSIPLKNIKPIGGKPLCAWVLEAAAEAESIDAVYVSTDSTQIKDVVDSLSISVEIINRPSTYATDEASTESVMLHFMEKVDFDNLITIQATSPLLESWHLNEALTRFKKEKLDSMLSAVRIKRFFWTDDARPINYDPLDRPRRQDFSGTLMENGAFYITKSKILTQTGCRLGGQIGIYEMPEHTAVELDEPHDWEVVSSLLENR
ncbi:MAG: cytidylyltransferase domain-containing protein [Desulfurivibrionaceae bacterium]